MKLSSSKEEYLKDPCGASSLPFWKTEQLEIPENIYIFRDDEFNGTRCCGTDEPYFKMINVFKSVPYSVLADEYKLTDASLEEFADHIRECYTEEYVTTEELETYTYRDVYDQDLWITIREKATERIVASGIGEFDARIGEGILDWIQVSPGHRRKGLGQVIVCELIKRLSEKARFMTVSGRVNNSNDPFALYRSCGFTDPVIWHIVTE